MSLPYKPRKLTIEQIRAIKREREETGRPLMHYSHTLEITE